MTERTRLPWSDYFMSIAHAAAKRSTCDRKHVGCVLVVENRIIATGYNGSVPGAEHCDDVGHDLVGQHCARCGLLKEHGGSAGTQSDCDGRHDWVGGNCVRTVHAEVNAVAQAARFGVPTRGAFAYVNTFPCWKCFQVLALAGVKSVIYDDMYREDQRVHDAALVASMTIAPIRA